MSERTPGMSEPWPEPLAAHLRGQGYDPEQIDRESAVFRVEPEVAPSRWGDKVPAPRSPVFEFLYFAAPDRKELVRLEAPNWGFWPSLVSGDK